MVPSLNHTTVTVFATPPEVVVTTPEVDLSERNWKHLPLFDAALSV